MHDAILTAMNNLVIPRVVMAVRSITGSSENGPNSLVQNPARRVFMGNTESTPLRSTSGRLDLNIEQLEIDETRDIDNSEDGDFTFTRLIYDRRAHAHHTNFAALFSLAENLCENFFPTYSSVFSFSGNRSESGAILF